MKSWKTTLFGVIAAAANLFANGWQAGNFSWKQFLVSLGFLGLGVFSKDHNVSGT